MCCLVGAASGMEAVVAPSVRSFMSKLVSAGDQGKTNSLTNTNDKNFFRRCTVCVCSID